jgi:hypothetical protein
MLWTLIRKMLGSNLDRNIGYPDWHSSWFSSVSAAKFWDSIPIDHDVIQFG